MGTGGKVDRTAAPPPLVKEAPMRKLSSRLVIAAMTFVLLAIGEGLSARAAEIEVAYTKHARQTLSETKADPGYPGTGELAQQIFLDTDIDAPADFFVIESRSYNQDNTIAGNGTHRGYEVLIFKNGDRAYSKFEGSHKVTTKEGGAFEVNYEGTQSFIGGTGTYKDIKGPGTYKGRITPDSFQEENKWSVTY
jgi:hypothetical protein